MTIDFLQIEHLLRNSKTKEALEMLEECASQANPLEMAQICYLQGNAYRQLGNWRKAIGNYNLALQYDPNSPARKALKNANEILDFFNHDLYNP